MVALAAAALAATLFAGCAPEPSPEPAPKPTASDDAGTAAPAKPTLLPNGSADDNLPLFTDVTERVWASGDRTHGRAYIDALVEAGFDKKAMQVTADLSTVQRHAESILFSVKWGDECLIGQVGPETGEPVATVMDVVGEGVCLIGNTRDIDW